MRENVAFRRNPVFEGQPDAHSTALGGWLLGIDPHSDNKEAAGELIEVMTSPEIQIWAATNDNRAPGNQAVYNSEELSSMYPLSGFLTDFEYGVVRPSAEAGQNYPRISEIMQAELTEALHQEKTPEEALSDAAEQIRMVTGE
ncbi:hypothetical protein [Oceanicola granulosus]|uniref:hypothetical protein n=1 Tax=Oceanicola granulosus TaxID=252302 RepID=UPI00315CAB0D